MKYLAIFLLIFAGVKIVLKIVFQEPLAKNMQKKIRIEKNLTDFLRPYIRLPCLNEQNLKNRLIKAHMNEDPKTFIANAVVKNLPFIILAVMAFANESILAMPVIMMAVFVNYKYFTTIEERTKYIQRKIIEELPEFMSYATNCLKFSKDITEIVENYLNATNQILKRELQQLLADLKTGNTDDALYKFDMRINVTPLSDYISVVRAMLDGETQISNLEVITVDMERFEYEEAKKYTEELPNKIAKASFFVGGSFIGFFIAVILMIVFIELNSLN